MFDRCSGSFIEEPPVHGERPRAQYRMRVVPVRGKFRRHVDADREFPDDRVAMEILPNRPGTTGHIILSEGPTVAAYAPTWGESPCASCIGSPCCRNVPITKISIDTEADLLDAAWLAGLEAIEIGLRDDGTWTVFYQQSCRFLDDETGGCRLHELPDQPDVCVRYDARTCWYRHAFAHDASPRFIRFDRERLLELHRHVICDEKGEIRKVPDWEDILTMLQAVPLGEPSGTRETGGTATECELLMPPARPATIRQLDLVKFRLGFPGISLVVSETEWRFSLRTSVLGDHRDGPPRRVFTAIDLRPYGLLPDERRIDRAMVPRLATLCAADEAGLIVAYPTVLQIDAEITGPPSDTSPDVPPGSPRAA
ncbi:MAG: hypothetical protein EA426_12965 [Spirochaetaceae bacterium]|nr:MAG: hypothetical protein EA426_12965 [Spirochaetaceae bacterium]